jgi:ATP-dependent DNA helicase RecQ
VSDRKPPPTSPWQGEGSDRERQIAAALREDFGFEGLRPGQGPIIADLLEGKPVLAVMPTGSGKSLCYQLPAVLFGRSGGVTIVVSPLIALMKDQVDALGERGVRSASLTSADGYDRQTEILAELAAGELPLLYVAPERFRSARFTRALDQVRDQIALFAIDEAHCISEWGHDFRPAYRHLGDVLAELRPPRVIALTATATPEVREDICRQLKVGEVVTHVHGFARPNLNLQVVPTRGKKDKERRLIELVRTRPRGTALVYAATRKNTERYASAIGEAGMRTAAYHAGLADAEREAVQEAFMAGELDAIVATNAFGMGVDKADIRLVAHADMPRSPEAYYQEAGRGGRDGAPADCVLLFQQGDVRLQQYLIDSSYPSPEVLRGTWKLLRDHPEIGGSNEVIAKNLPGEPTPQQVRSAIRVLARHGFLTSEGNRWIAVTPDQLPGEFPELDPEALAARRNIEIAKLRRMTGYAYGSSCRHRFLLGYFGDPEQPRECRACDNCLDRGRTREATEAERAAMRGLLHTIARRSGRLGRKKIADITREASERGDFGPLAVFTANQLMDLIDALEGAGLVSTSPGHYPTLAITGAGREAVDGALPDVRVMVAAKTTSSKRAVSAAAQVALEGPEAERLQNLRRRLARERAVPPYVIYNNRTIAAIVRAAPRTLEELARVPGIGPAKLTSYGEAILEALAS